jgi:hypothetical protein
VNFRTSSRRKRAIALFVVLIAMLLIGGQTAIELATQDDDTIALRSQATAEETSPINSGLTLNVVAIVAACLIVLILANAIAEAADDSVLGSLKQVMGGGYVKHLYFPVEIKAAGGAAAIRGRMLALGRRRVTLISPVPLGRGTSIVLVTEPVERMPSTVTRLHGVVKSCRGDDGTKGFAVECRLTPENAREKAAIGNWISALTPRRA